MFLFFIALCSTLIMMLVQVRAYSFNIQLSALYFCSTYLSRIELSLFRIDKEGGWEREKGGVLFLALAVLITRLWEVNSS